MSQAKAIAALVRDFFARQSEPILARLTALEQRAPVAGPKGEPGAQGSAGERGEQGPAGRDADPELIRLAVAEILPPLVDNAKAMLREHIDAGLPALKGERGADGSPGRDGESVHPDTVRAMVAEQVRLAMADMPKPRDGEPGRDATAIEYRDGIDESKSYPRGTHALYRGGVIVAMRATDPLNVIDVTKLCSTAPTLPVADLTAAGWAVAMNGTHTDVEESLDKGRTVRRTLMMTNGIAIVSERKTSVTIYRGVWKHDTEYSRGDMVTRDGSVWHCEAEATKEEPGKSPAWRLAVKRGNHGRDGKDVTK